MTITKELNGTALTIALDGRLDPHQDGLCRRLHARCAVGLSAAAVFDILPTSLHPW